VASLIAVLDRDFSLTDGGQWSEGGYAVPAGSVFWTDLGPGYELPEYVARVRTQGNWGVYRTVKDFTVPSGNPGGRYTRICP